MNKIAAAMVSVFGILIAINLYFYITTCGWQPRELMHLLSVMFAAFACGLFLDDTIRP